MRRESKPGFLIHRQQTMGKDIVDQEALTGYTSKEGEEGRRMSTRETFYVVGGHDDDQRDG